MATARSGGNGDGRDSTPTAITGIADYFSNLSIVLKNLPIDLLQQFVDALMIAYQEDRTVFVFGNGGSAALASHFACDLGKGTAVESAKRLRVVSLTDNVPLITAWANDSAYEDIFAEQLKNFLQPKDIALAISGSGNSPNVLKGLKVARAMGSVNIGLSGFRGGKMKALCNLCFVVPSESMQFIEDMHLSVTHAIFSVVRHQIREHNSMKEAQVLAASAVAGSV